MRSRILIIGTLPQTAGIGGVTIHVDRLVKWLEKESYPVDLCDYKRLSYWKQLKLIWQHKILHIHVSNPFLRVFYVGLSILFFKKSILTIHGDIGRFGLIKNLLDQIAIRLSSVTITVNMTSFIISRKWNRKTLFISAFIPPYENEDIPIDLAVQIQELRNMGNIICCTNASAMSFTKNGEEIYGIEFLIDYFKNRSDMALVISDPSGAYSKKYKYLTSNIIIISEPHSFFAVIKNTDIFIRATATDGDSLSVKESLYLNKPTIATNCVPRPENVILYEYNNMKSLSMALQHASNKNDWLIHEEPTIRRINSLYISLLKK